MHELQIQLIQVALVVAEKFLRFLEFLLYTLVEVEELLEVVVVVQADIELMQELPVAQLLQNLIYLYF
jgi:hypothetical protein